MKAFDYFLELTQIPRGSFNEKGVATYLCEFAKRQGLQYSVDDVYNVKIYKNNNSPKTIILQAHTDMVCEKLKGVAFDFEREPIRTQINGDYITAKGTTLGGDDGFGVSLILEMLENCGSGYPNIWAIFTTQEEIGMGGAKAIDVSDVKADYFLGLDGTSSNELIISSAGSCMIDFEKHFSTTTATTATTHTANGTQANAEEHLYKLEVAGLLGGHSGEDIDKGRANANKIGFAYLKEIAKHPLKIAQINGGDKVNAIPREFVALFSCPLPAEEMQEIVRKFTADFTTRFTCECGAVISVEKVNGEGFADKLQFLSEAESMDLINFATDFKNGVIEKSEGGDLVICSNNLANLRLCGGEFRAKTMLRFNTSKAQNTSFNDLTQFAKTRGYSLILRDSDPFFEASERGELRQIVEKAYYDCGFANLKVLQIHAGLEGGVFSDKLPNLQVVVLGADLWDIHTPNEKMKISSLEKLSKWIKQIMQTI